MADSNGVGGRVEGKVALVTGGAVGMGFHHAKLLAQEGAQVVLADIQEERGEVAAKEIGHGAAFRVLDVSEPEAWSSLVREVSAEFGNITVLVNNAGIGGEWSLVADLPVADYLKTIQVDLHGVLFGMQAVIPGMLEAGGGSIINISSTSGIAYTSGTPNAAYAAAKFGVRGLTRAAAIDYADKNIRVNSVHPGVVVTPLAEMNLALLGPEWQARFQDSIPMKRFASPDEISPIVLYLASDESSYSTGAEFVLDGGVLAA